MLTIRHFKIFKAVSDYSSMSEAAKRLYISQPTVSQTIQEIEKYYGTRLFERYPRRLYITEAGKRLLSYVNPLLYSFDSVVDLTLDNPERCTMRVGATYTVSSCILSDILTEAKKEAPYLDVCVSIDNTQNMEQKLLNNELDFALVEGIIKSRDIITMPIAEDCLVLVCSSRHAFARQSKITIADLNGQDFILREMGSGTRKLFETKMAARQISYRVKWECAGFDTIKSAVIANEGIAVISARMIQEEVLKGDLFVIRLSEFIWKRNFFLCYHKNKTITPEMQPFFQAASSYQNVGVNCPVFE